MKVRKKILLLLLVSLLGLMVGYIFTNSLRFGLCVQSQYSCRDLFNNLGDPLFYGMSALSVIFLFLFFIPHAFPAWEKFAKWFIPIATLLFIFYPEPGAGDLFSPYPEQVFKWVSVLYVLASLAIIARSKVTDKV